MAFKKNARQYILAIAVCMSVAIPVLCLPVGLRDGVSPSLRVRRAYAATFPEQEKTEEEIAAEEAMAQAQAEADAGLIMAGQGTLVESTYNDGYIPPQEAEESFGDVPAYTVYQNFDEAGLPIELLDTQYFAPAPENEYLYIASSNSILKESPVMDSMTLDTLATGEGVTRIAIGDTWSKIQTSDGVEGYVLTSTLSYEMVWVAIDRTVWVDTDSLSLRAEPNTSSEVVATLSDETRLRCTGIADKWYEVTTDSGLHGYVYISYTTQTPPPTPTPTPVPRTSTGGGGGGSSSGGGGSSSGGGGRVTGGTPIITGANGSSVVSAAESMLGVSYVYGGESASGVDCSGLVVYCYRQIGVGGLPHYANSLVNYGQPVSRENIQPGDIVCYDYGGGYCGHVAIYVGGGQVIHASNSREDVRYGSLDMMPILTIRRIVG
ncbi:MAG: C40 family peptidase [Saccharofermentans sp.]|nr:C40 family peptidase [Saccharofermentans sp.]